MLSARPSRETRAETADTESTTAGEELTEDELFEVLANQRRRYALHALSSTDEQWDIGSLAEQVAAWENETSPDEVTRTERKSVYTALQQLHLPKMDDMGFVEYDKDRGTVSPTRVQDDVDIYLDVVRGDDIPWSEYYLSLASFSAVLVVVAWLDIFPFSVVGDIVWAGIVVGVFAASALLHNYFQGRIRLGEAEPPPLDDT